MTRQKKGLKQLETEKPDFLEVITEGTTFQWIVSKRKVLPYLFLGLVALVTLALKFSFGKTERAEASYLQAENYYALLHRKLQETQNKANTLVPLDKLQAITDSYPELNSKYDGLIAQLLLAQGENVKGEKFATRAIKRAARDDLPNYTAFSKTTLAIVNGDYEKALSEAKALKDNMRAQNGRAENSVGENLQGSPLFVFNLLRIAMLEKEVGTPEGEWAAWEEWEVHAKRVGKTTLADAFSLVNEQLREGAVTLNRYLHARKSALEKKL